MSSSNPEYVVAIHQSGLKSTPDGSGVTMTPDAFQRNRAGLDRVREFQSQGKSVRAVILGGGQVYEGYPPLYDFARAYLEGNGLSGIPVIEADSLNTVHDIDTTRFIMRQMGIENGVTISNGSHFSARVYSFLSNLRHPINKVHLRFESAEDIRERNHPNDSKVLDDVKKFQYSPANLKVALAQLGLAALLLTPGLGPKKYIELSQKSLKTRTDIK